MSNTVQVGSKLRNNDPRFPNQVVEVIETKTDASGTYAIYKGGRRRCKVNVKRIVTDPKNLTYNQGWTLVDPQAIDVA